MRSLGALALLFPILLAACGGGGDDPSQAEVVDVKVLTMDGGRLDWSHDGQRLAFDRFGPDGFAFENRTALFHRSARGRERVWEDRRFTENYANISEFDFVDLHMYPLASPTTNYFTEYLSRLNYLKADAPGKKILAVEGWLFKASPDELAGGVGVIATEVFAREVYSYWAPLDQRFLEINTKIAHKYDFAMLGMAWTRYYFAYLTPGDPSLIGLTPSQIIAKANQVAGLAMLNGEVSSTGNVFKQLAQGEGFAR